MDIFLDTMCPHHIKEAMATGLLNGLTTNPTLMKKFFITKEEKAQNKTKNSSSREKNTCFFSDSLSFPEGVLEYSSENVWGNSGLGPFSKYSPQGPQEKRTEKKNLLEEFWQYPEDFYKPLDFPLKDIPSSLRSIPVTWWQHLVFLGSLCTGPLSIQVFQHHDQGSLSESLSLCFEKRVQDMVSQGLFYKALCPSAVVKVPCTPEGLRACQELVKNHVPVNVTLCFTPFQALLAAKSQATYVSPFLGRLNTWCQDHLKETPRPKDHLENPSHNPLESVSKSKDYLGNTLRPQNEQSYPPLLRGSSFSFLPFFRSFPSFTQECFSFGGGLIHEIHQLFQLHGYKTKILAASLRSLQDIGQSLYFGAHCITISPQLFWTLFQHPLGIKGLETFSKDFLSCEYKV